MAGDLVLGGGSATDLVPARPGTPGPPPAAGRPRATLPTPRQLARSPKGVALWLAILGMGTLSFNVTRVGGFTVADLFFLASAGAIVFELITDTDQLLAPKRYRAGSQLVLVGALLLLTFETISALESWAPLASMMVVVRMGWTTLLWFWLVRTVSRDREAYMSLIRAYQVSVVVSAIAGLLGYYGIAFVSTDWGDRQAALTYHPGEFMNFMISGFWFFLMPTIMPDHGGVWPQRSNLKWGVSIPLLALAIFSTGSTSALLALGASVLTVGGVALVAGSGRARRRSPIATLALVGLAAAGMFALATSHAPIVERLNGDTAGLDGSIESRERSNSAIVDEFDHYLVVGIGPFFASGAGSSVAESQVGAGGVIHNGVHNMWLKTLYESGLVSLVGLWIIILATARQAYRLVLATRNTALYPIALACVGSLTCAVVSSQFGPTNYARHFWLPFALISGLWAVRRHELDDLRAAEIDRMPAPRARR
ncbi:MAG TPA: O-antigen ligase family protein [Acidimicrobiales bacterium]|nr:O-antigen ligase family protein [Acidimicrobiales bacterium]